MLVLSRRPSERIVLPTINTVVEILQIKGNVARIGVNAPREVAVLRGELVDEHAEYLQDEFVRKAMLARELNHRTRNTLNTATIGLSLIDRQLKAGMVKQAQQTMQTVLREIAQVNEQPAEPLPASTGDAIKTLVVEDNSNERRLLAGFLRSAGFDVATAGDGAEAIDYLNSNQPAPDVVLMDMVLPKCDGRTAVKVIRTDPRHRGMRIFAVSGNHPTKLGMDVKETGIDRWFLKPLDPEQLADAISAECQTA